MNAGGTSLTPPSWLERGTHYRGFFPDARAASARDIRALWAKHLADSPSVRPIWMHVHVPYCPQICTFCHCGKVLLTEPSQIAQWLQRTREEVAFYAPAMRGASVRVQYFGGGTPNVLAPGQLDELLDLLEGNFAHEPNARRTLEMLPSAYHAGTLEVAARHGIRRLSAGVQSTERTLLDAVGRSPDFAPLKRMMDEATRLGIDDVNVDMAWRLPGDTEARFFRSLADVLDVRPTTVSIHLLAPTARNPVFSSASDEAAMYRAFRGFSDGPLAQQLATTHPDYIWRKLPTVMTLVRRDYLAAGRYRTWQYSDMEPVGIDMFGLGRWSISHILGVARYENLNKVHVFEPDATGYQLSVVNGMTDAAMDVLAELMRDNVCDVTSIAAYYGMDAFAPVQDLLDSLVARGHLQRESARYTRSYDETSLLLGPVGELLALAKDQALKSTPQDVPPARPRRDLSKENAPPAHVTLKLGDIDLKVFVELARPERRYYHVVAPFGLYYPEIADLPRKALGGALDHAVEVLAEIVREMPGLVGSVDAASQAATALQQRLDGQPAT